MVNIVHNIITFGTSIIVLQSLMNTLVAKAVATFCHVCLLSHIKADVPGTPRYYPLPSHLVFRCLPHMMLTILLPMLTGIPLDSDMIPF